MALKHFDHKSLMLSCDNKVMTVSGYAVDGAELPIPQYAGMFGVKSLRIKNSAYQENKNTNAWTFVAPKSIMEQEIYVSDPDTVEIYQNGNKHIQTGMSLYDLSIPPEEMIGQRKITVGDIFSIGEASFTATPTEGQFAVLEVGKNTLAVATSAPTESHQIYFEILEKEMQTVGISQGGVAYVVHVKKVLPTII